MDFILCVSECFTTYLLKKLPGFLPWDNETMKWQRNIRVKEGEMSQKGHAQACFPRF